MRESVSTARETMRETAQPVADTAKERTSALADTTTQEARATTQDVRAHAHEMLTQARSELRTQAADQTDRLAGTLREMSEQLSAMGRREGAPNGMLADAIAQLSSAARQGATTLESGGIDAVMDDMRAYARNRPGMFLLGAVGAGFVAGRLVKALDRHSLMDAARNERWGDDPNALNGYRQGELGSSWPPPPLAGADPLDEPVPFTEDIPTQEIRSTHNEQTTYGRGAAFNE
ncbi:MAG: hypothetical protein AB7L13_06070 [Acidimicrobiia bacterium]